MNLIECGRRIWEAAIAAVEPGRLIRESVSRDGDILRIDGETYNLGRYENIFLIAFGKAAPAMAAAFMAIAGERVRDGVVAVLPGETAAIPGLKIFEAPHPLPDSRSVAAAEAALALARRGREKDLIVVLLSGGGSAQACAPAEGVFLEDKVALTRELLRRGADIFELNSVRKHLSAIKGGRLALAARPASMVCLAISDVLGDDLGTIASGPAHWDSSTFEEARRVLGKFDLWENGPASVKRTIEEGACGLRPETPKKSHPVFEHVRTSVIGDNAAALSAARTEAEALGFRPVVLTAADRGEAREIAARYAAVLLNALGSPRRSGEALCFLGGGELTVTVRGKGRGGRNQEFVLAALGRLENAKIRERLDDGRPGEADWLVASVGTDGIDGGTDAAGAWGGPETISAARRSGLDPGAFLDDNDSHEFFRRTGGLIVTGPTGTNVMDIRMMLLAWPLAVILPWLPHLSL